MSEKFDVAFLAECFSASTIASLLRVSRRTIDRWRVDRGLPSYMIVGRRLFHLGETLDWLAENALAAAEDIARGERRGVVAAVSGLVRARARKSSS